MVKVVFLDLVKLSLSEIMNNFNNKRGKNNYNFFRHPYTLSNEKKKEQMKKAVQVFHSCVIADVVKKFMNYDFMGDLPNE